MTNQFCGKCGAALTEGHAFCANCGAPAGNAEFCSKCSTALEEGQDFCPNCGQKKGIILDTNTSSAIAQFNEGLTKKKKNKGLKVALGIIIPCVLIVVAAILFSVLTKFGGKYEYVSGSTYYSYTFTDGVYKYDSDDDRESGTYVVEKNTVTLTDSDGDDSTFIKKGNYLYARETYFDGKYDPESTSDQIFTKSFDFTYDGTDLNFSIEFILKTDGTYSYSTEMKSVEYPSIKEESSTTGTYRIEDDMLWLTPEDENYEKLNFIINGTIYDSVYEKQD